VTSPLLDVKDLRVEFPLRRGLWTREMVRAVDQVSLHVAVGETIGLVGESGSGKSTLARAIARLVPAAAGRVLLRGQDLLQMSGTELRQSRRHLQMVFQDPLASLNPRMTVGDALQEPLRIFRPDMPATERIAAVKLMLERVGLQGGVAGRYPRAFSGGQCQRIGIARAMILEPALLICDEPVSSLDVSIQGQIVNLLLDMQRDTGAAMLFIGHNLGIVRHVSRRVYVMYRGRIVEVAASDELFARPRHPYTRALIASIPQIPAVPSVAGLVAPPPAAAEPLRSGGCAFRDRCPHAREVCAAAVPVLTPVGGEHEVACLRSGEI
jgi:oligopeptide transport system ATP-binding protein